MKTPKYTHAFLLISLVVYNYFFWKESFGLNMFLFSLMLIVFQMLLNPGSSNSRYVRITVAGTLLSAAGMLLFNSGLSKVVHIISFTVMSGFIHENRLRSVFFAMLQTLSAYISLPSIMRQQVREIGNKNVPVKSGFRTLRLAFAPLIVTVVFYMIFLAANPVFKQLSGEFWNEVADFFSRFFDFISFPRLVFLLFGLIILSGLLYRQQIQMLLNRELGKSDLLRRVRKGFRKGPASRLVNVHAPESSFPLIALKNENREGVMLIGMVNLVLLVVNLIDISWVWFGFNAPANFSMKQFVHEGTYLLILSILLSIVILLYYFRNNQNFYPRNSLLRNLAFLWILQNLILCISVGLRNYHYINLHGLAYKRIGVIIFLILTFIGLLTMYRKISGTRSFYYLLRVNTWAAYAVFLAATLVNWDVQIAKFNLFHWNESQIDVDFYLELSDKALPVIYENLQQVKIQIEKHSDNQEIWIRHLSMESFMVSLERKKKKFLREESRHTWCSWNLPDHRTSRYLEGRVPIAIGRDAKIEAVERVLTETTTQAKEDDRFFEEGVTINEEQ